MNYNNQIKRAIEGQKLFVTDEIGWGDFYEREFMFTTDEECEGPALRINLSQTVNFERDEEGCREVGYNPIFKIQSVDIYLKIVDIYDEHGNDIKEEFHPQEIYHLENLVEEYIKEMQETDQVPVTKTDLL